MPIRKGLSWDEQWRGPDGGLIWCWERGRQKRQEDQSLAARADAGELVILAWRGGVEKRLKGGPKYGTLEYLATWQGLRNEDLMIDIDEHRAVTCARTGQVVVFRAGAVPENEVVQGSQD